MKNKFAKILGVVLTTVTLVSLFVVAAPVSAGTQTWSQFPTPSATGLVLKALNGGGPIAQASDASALYAYVLDGATPKLIKSVNNGRSWTTVLNPAPAAILEIVCSPTEPSVVFFITATTLYKYDPAATPALRAIVNVQTGAAFTSFDIGRYQNRYIAVFGTNMAGVNSTAGVYFWDENDVFNNLVAVGTDVFSAWMTAGDTGSVLAVRMSPTFATDRTVVAVGFDDVLNLGATAGKTIIRMNVNGGAWGAIAGLNVPAFGTALGVNATAADIAFPADFNYLTSPIYLVSVADADAADGAIYRIIGASATVADATDNVTNMSYQSNGTFASLAATVLAGTSAGTVGKSTNSGNTFAFAGSGSVTVRSTIATPAWVLLDKNYATSKMAWILNVGLAQGALGVTTDGSTFNQWSLISDTITTIVDYAVAPNGDIFMITSNGVTQSLYRQLVSAATPWERVKNAAPFATKLTLVADYATSKAIAYWTPAQITAIQVSTNSANSFSGVAGVPGLTIDAVANQVWAVYMPNATTIVVGDNTGTIITNQIAAGTTSAFWWNEVANAPFAAGFTVNQIVSAGGTNLLAVASNLTVVKVAKSANNGFSWSLLTAVGANADANLTVSVGGPAFVAPAADYATTGNIFVAASAGVFRYPSTAVAAVNGWLQVDGVAGVGTAAGLVAAAGGPGSAAEGAGMVYAADGSTANDVARIRGLSVVAETLLVAPATPPAEAFVNLQASSVAAGNVVLWAQTATTAGIWTFTDTLGVAGTGVAVSNLITAPAFILGFPLGDSSSGVVTWNALTNATNYIVRVNTVAQTNLYAPPVNAAGITMVYTAGATSAVFAGMDPGTLYYVSVWATTPNSSFMFGGTASFTTPLGAPTTPTSLVPVAGAIDVPVIPTFQWAPVTGATGYTLQVSKSDTFSPLVGSAVTLTGTAYVWTGSPLENKTSYYWRVQATLTGGTVGAWVTSAFTTVAVAPPPVTVTTQPQPTIIFPSAQPPVTVTINPAPPAPVLTVTQPIITLTTPPAGPTPSYIWIIVGVGAVLTIAVIILIIRTRRVV